MQSHAFSYKYKCLQISVFCILNVLNLKEKLKLYKVFDHILSNNGLKTVKTYRKEALKDAFRDITNDSFDVNEGDLSFESQQSEYNDYHGQFYKL